MFREGVVAADARKKRGGIVTANTRKKAERELARIEGAIGDRQFKSITKQALQKIIDARIADGVHAQKATHVRVVAFCRWAANRQEVENPAAGLDAPIEDTERDRYLDDAEIKLLWKAATDAGGAPGALVKLLLLTGCRRDEICYLERSEMNGEAITIKGERTKNKRPHRIPITPMIRKVLDERPAKNRFVVTGEDRGLGGHSKAKKMIDQHAPDLAHWTLHDLRRTFASGLARLGVPIQVTELCLNHKSGVRGNPLVRIYQQHDYAVEIVAAFEKWSKHVQRIVKAAA